MSNSDTNTLDDRNSLKFFFINNLDIKSSIKTIQPLKFDASFRRYDRILCSNNQSFILMDAPPSKEKVVSFVQVGKKFLESGFSVPEIYRSDIENGFLLLEDFGASNFKETLSNIDSSSAALEREYEYYMLSIEALLRLHKTELFENLPLYDEAFLLKESLLLIEWFFPLFMDKEKLGEITKEYISIWNDLFKLVKTSEDVVVHRDYHADNLIWLEEREGIKKVGILDFQDAIIGSPSYDIVSLLRDARRDVSDEVYASALDFYIKNNKSLDKDLFIRSCAILSAQRNCKIIGIFIRIAKTLDRQNYIDYLPRVFKNLYIDIEHSELKDLKSWFNKYLPKEARDVSFIKNKILE